MRENDSIKQQEERSKQRNNKGRERERRNKSDEIRRIDHMAEEERMYTKEAIRTSNKKRNNT